MSTMDIDFKNYNWDSPGTNIPNERHLIDDLFFGLNTNPEMQHDKCESQPHTERTRKVTITEITEEGVDNADEDWTILNGYPGKEEALNEDVTSDESDEEAVMETDEVFQILDDVVQDWKIKLECVVGDGLKKLRKAGKEKKLMIKYLPGENSNVGRKLGVPKATIMKDWKNDFNHVINGIQKKLDKLTREKAKEVDSLYNDKFLYTNTNVKKIEDLNKNKKRVINIDCRDDKAKEKATFGFTGLKQLIRELNKMCEKVASTNCMMNENVVPIYNMYNDNCYNHIVSNQYETPLNQYLRYLTTLPAPNPTPNFSTTVDSEVIAKHQANILDALDDFCNKQTQHSKLLKMKMKDTRRDSNRIATQRKMIQRKINRRTGGTKTKQGKKNESRCSYKMKHYSKDGKDHYLIVRKREPTEKIEVEDIFEDWRSLTLDDIDDRKRQRTPRVRKLSHRAMRKEMLKDQPASTEGPVLYSDVLKRNLKYRPNIAPVEDIFEAWRDYLQELDDLLSSSLPSSTESSRHPSGEDDNDIMIQKAKEEQITESSERILETAIVYQKELQSCGHPTVRTVPYDLNNCNDRIQADVVKSFSIAVNDCVQPETDKKQDMFQAPFGNTRTQKLDAKKKRRVMKYQPEIYFAGWRYNLKDFSDLSNIPKVNSKKRYETEEYFRVWKRHFFVRENSKLTEERKRRQDQPKMMPEKIFNEWLHNFHFKNHHWHQNKYGSLKRHNSQRAGRESIESNTSHEYEKEEEMKDTCLKYKSRTNRQRRSRKNKHVM